MKNFKKYIGILLPMCSLLACLGFIFFMSMTMTITTQVESIPYTEFVELVESGDVCRVVYGLSDETMTVYLHNDETRGLSIDEIKDYSFKNENMRYTTYPAYDDFRKDMLEKDIVLELKKETNVWGYASTFVSILFPIAMLYVLFRSPIFNDNAHSNGGGILSGTSAMAKNLIRESDVKFSDVIGHDEILDDIKFITKLIKEPQLGSEIGAKPPKGVLLGGEPGTGKTLIAKAIAGEAEVPFLYVNSSSLIEKYVGVGAKRVRDIFQIAKQHAPCILFIDEIDAIGVDRDKRGVGNSEHEQTIDALLQEMDGFSGREGVFIIAATNRMDKLDTALIRAGRFDRQIVVNKPRDWKVRAQLFNHYLSKFKVSDDVNVEGLSKQVTGFTGADIEAICNEASIIAMMRELSFVDNSCLEEAVDKKVFKGNRSKEEHYKNDKVIVAYHEAGHAVMHYLMKQPISRASIIGTTSGVGGVVFGADTDSCFITDKELRERVMICYGGRASEEIKFQTVTTGASSDITQATNIMSAYIKRYGFEDDFGLVDMTVLEDNSFIEGSSITSRVSEMSKCLYKDTIDILKKNYNLVEVLAKKLLEVETISGDDILLLFESMEKEYDKSCDY